MIALSNHRLANKRQTNQKRDDKLIYERFTTDLYRWIPLEKVNCVTLFVLLILNSFYQKKKLRMKEWVCSRIKTNCHQHSSKAVDSEPHFSSH